MEFWIAFVVTIVVGSIFRMGKKHGKKSKPVHSNKLKQADEELITVILPTINN